MEESTDTLVAQPSRPHRWEDFWGKRMVLS